MGWVWPLVCIINVKKRGSGEREATGFFIIVNSHSQKVKHLRMLTGYMAATEHWKTKRVDPIGSLEYRSIPNFCKSNERFALRPSPSVGDVEHHKNVHLHKTRGTYQKPEKSH